MTDELNTARGLDPNEPNRGPISRRRVESIRESIIRTYEEPVLPKLCKILFISMLILTAAMLLVEVSTFIRFHSETGHFLRNLSTTCAVIWSIYAVLLGLCCCLGMRSNTKGYWKRVPDRAEQTAEELQRCKQAVRRLNSTYWLYLRTCLGGILVWLALFAIVRCFF